MNGARTSTEVYRNALAREVRLLGYEIDDRRDAKGRDCGFEIRGVSGVVLDRFSQRSRQRDAAIEDFVRKRGRMPTDNEIAVLVRESRADKLTDISTADLRDRQFGRITPEELQQELRGFYHAGRVASSGLRPPRVRSTLHRIICLNECLLRVTTRF